MAALAAALVTHQKISSVYDHEAGRYVSLTAEAVGDQLKGFDYGRGAYVGGRSASVYDYGVRNYLQFRVNGFMVEGYDYASRHYFQAHVNGRSVSIYDYQVGRYFRFTTA